MEQKLGLIGAGNMAGAILDGVLGSGLIPAEHLAVSDPDGAKRERYRLRGVFTSAENRAVAERSDIILLAVKPQVLSGVLPELAACAAGKCVVSIAPGFSVSYLKESLPGCYIIRAMPNTPLQVGRGVTALAEAPEVPEPLFRAVEAIFSAAGAVTVVPEKQMNAVTALTSSSPAYFFRMADAMEKGAAALGMEPGEALRLAALTMEGAARVLLESGKTAEELTRQVCSPGGTTLAALTAFDEFRFDEMIRLAMERCARRAEELGK